MKNYILLWVCLWCAGQLCAETAASKSLDINIVGHVLDKNTREHLPYISVVLKGTTIGVMTDAPAVPVCLLVSIVGGMVHWFP